MKNAISNVWLLGIIISFILLFSAYIAITVNYSTSFRLKNEILDIIEKHKGITNYPGKEELINFAGNPKYKLVTNAGTLQTINLYLRGNSYTAMGTCDGEYDYGVKELTFDGNVNVPKVEEDERYYYCLSKHPAGIPGPYGSVYYRVRLFYKFEVPVLSEFFAIKVEGMTNEIYKPVDPVGAKDEIIKATNYDFDPKK